MDFFDPGWAPMAGRGSSRPSRQWSRRLVALLLPLLLVVGSLAVPPWARSDGAQLPGQPLALRQVPGPSPRQTIANFLATTAQAHQLIHGAIDQGRADPGWFYTPGQRHQVEQGQGLLDQATEALNLSELPQALHPISGVGTMVMLRSLLLYDLAHHPGLVLPGPNEVASQGLKTWTIPETPITLALNQPEAGAKASPAALPCQQCSDQDFLFSPRTVAQVDADFNRLFAQDPALRHRFGGDLYVTWSLLPGGALPPKWMLRLPVSWKHWLVNQPFGGQSLLQWLILVPSSTIGLALGLGLLLRVRHQFRPSAGHLGRSPYWQRVGLLLPLLPLLSLWRWFCIDWVNLTGDRALVVLVTARVLNMAVAAPLLYLLAEAVGQSLIRKRQRSAEGTLVLVRRKGGWPAAHDHPGDWPGGRRHGVGIGGPQPGPHLDHDPGDVVGAGPGHFPRDPAVDPRYLRWVQLVFGWPAQGGRSVQHWHLQIRPGRWNRAVDGDALTQPAAKEWLPAFAAQFPGG